MSNDNKFQSICTVSTYALATLANNCALPMRSSSRRGVVRPLCMTNVELFDNNLNLSPVIQSSDLAGMLFF